MGQHKEGNWSHVIIPIKRRRLFNILAVIFSLLMPFLIFGIFGSFFGDNFEAVLVFDNVNQVTQIELTIREIRTTHLLISFQRILIYFLPGLLIFIYWFIRQLAKRSFPSHKSNLRVFLYFETITLFSYSLFETIYYLTAMEFWFEIPNPFSAVNSGVFIIGLAIALVLEKNVFSNDDEMIANAIFSTRK